jgi:transcriptional regulator with XRE-family HTH domain
MSSELADWLRRQREDRGWTRTELARQLIRAARARGDTSMPGADNISHNIYRWERGAVAPAERYKLLYCGAFGIPFGQFGTAPPPGMVDSGPAVPVASAYRETPPPERDASAIRREVLMAAHEGSEHAEGVEQRGIGEATLEQFRADTASLAVAYLTGETFGLFTEMRRVRNRITEALDRRQWPRDAAELYLLAGCLSALMAAAAVNLGYPEAAGELTRAGWAYATVIDHRPLMARLRLCAAYAAYWSGHPEAAAGPGPQRAGPPRRRPGRGAAAPVRRAGRGPPRRRRERTSGHRGRPRRQGPRAPRRAARDRRRVRLLPGHPDLLRGLRPGRGGP